MEVIMLRMRSMVMGLAVMGVAASAEATPIVQALSFTEYPDYNHIFTFNKFDKSKGTLNSVTIQLQVDVNGGYYKVENVSSTGATGTATFGTTAKLAGPTYMANDNDALITAAVSAVTSQSVSLAPTDTHQDFLGADSFKLDGASKSVTNSGSVGGAYINSFNATVAKPTFAIEVDSAAYMNAGTLGGVAGAFVPQSATSTVTVTYDYTIVPEPTMLGAIAVGAVSVLGLRKRNKKA